jgi:hypothetical protein
MDFHCCEAARAFSTDSSQFLFHVTRKGREWDDGLAGVSVSKLARQFGNLKQAAGGAMAALNRLLKLGFGYGIVN